MRIFKISDSASNKEGIDYLAYTLKDVISDVKGECKRFDDEYRSGIKISVTRGYADYIRSEIEDKIADVIAVGYKYDCFKKGIGGFGLSDFERELLYSALIAADIDEDKRYAVRKMRNFDEYAVDGIFEFRLTPLKRKWADVIGYIPTAFTSGQMMDFVRYLIGEKRGKKAIVENGKVYDGNYNLLQRTFLLPKSDEGKIVKEVILSASGRIETDSIIPESDKRYLRDFYGNRMYEK